VKLPDLSWPSLPSPEAWRHAVRLAVAAVVSAQATHLLGLQQGFWAVITAIIIMQGSQNGTLGAAMDRLLATIAGGLLGVAVVWIGSILWIPQAVRLVVAIVPFAMLAMQRPSFRLAPVTAAIVVMISGSGEEALQFALDRLVEISIGSVIGVATVHLVLPGPARAIIRDGTAAILQALGAAALAHLTHQAADSIAPLDTAVRHQLSEMTAASKEETREHAIHLSVAPPAAPLLRTLRRLQEDVTIIARVMAMETADGPDRAALGATVQAQFSAAADFLREAGTPPDLAALDALIDATAADSTLQFALLTLRRDLADVADRMCECLELG
jgi:uncharacterized membrane protein YccC